MCSVCYEDFTLGETVLQLPCKHCYHSNCVISWIKMKNSCPYCLTKIFAPPLYLWFIRVTAWIAARIIIKRFRFIGIFYCFSNFGTILIKRFQYIGIFYCFSNFGTILIIIIIILFFFRTSDWNRKSPKPQQIQSPNSTHIWTLIRRCA